MSGPRGNCSDLDRPRRFQSQFGHDTTAASALAEGAEPFSTVSDMRQATSINRAAQTLVCFLFLREAASKLVDAVERRIKAMWHNSLHV